MVTIGVEQFQREFLEALRRVEAGETLLIVRDNAPIAEITLPRKLRPIGLAAGQFRVPDNFNEPLPSEVLDAFEGKNQR